MGTYRRINVDSGRPLERLAQYSRALRVGDRVLLSGTRAIDPDGNVIGEGDMAKQVEAIMEIAQSAMGKAGGRLEDVVRSRIYVTDVALGDTAGRAIAKYFREARPAATLVQVNRLARPAQLIEIELETVDGAKENAQRISSGRPTEDLYSYSRAVRVGDRIFVAGTTAFNDRGEVTHPGDLYGQTRETLATIAWAVEQAGATLADLVYSKTYLTDVSQGGEQTRARLEALGDIRPTSTVVGIPGLLRPELVVEIEAEAIVGAAAVRRDIYTQHEREKGRGYARAVQVGDLVHVSGCTSMDAEGKVRAPDDWAAQYDLCHQGIQWALEQAGAKLDDVVQRHIFTVEGAEMNRPYGEGPPWFAASRPISLGCRIAGLAHPQMLVEVDAMAIKGAHAGIEWLGAFD